MGYMEEIIKKLQEQKTRCLKDESLAGKVQIETDLFSATMGGLLEAARLQKQLDEAQEQNSMKPSVARRLNDRIRELEAEIAMLRDASRVTELEKKVHKLEGELKQSYATKNYTLKSGLLDMEKRYRDYIYASPDVEELWTEVMMLLIEDKEIKEDMLKVRSKHIAELAEKERSKKQLTESEAGEEDTEEHLASVAKQVDLLKDGGNLTPILPHIVSHLRSSSSSVSASHLGVADARSVEILEDGGHVNVGFVQGVRVVYAGKGLPSMRQPIPHALSNVGIITSGGTVDASALQQHKDYVTSSIHQLREIFSHLTPPPLSGAHATTSSAATNQSRAVPDASYLDQQVDSLAVSVEELMRMYGGVAPISDHDVLHSGDGAHAVRQPYRPADASYLDSKTEAVLASIRELQALYDAHGGGLTAAQARGGGAEKQELRTPDASYFSTQSEALAASIANLRLMYSNGQGGPLQPGGDVAARQAYATGLAASPSSGAEGGAAAEDNVAHCFSSFMHQLEGQGISLLRQNRESQGTTLPAGVAAEGDEEEGTQLDSTQHPDVVELSRMFAGFALAPGGLLSHRIKTSGERGALSSHAHAHAAQQPYRSADASYFDRQTEAALASIRELQALYDAHGGGLMAAQSRGGDAEKQELHTPDASYFSTQAEALTATIANLRLMYNNSQGGPVQLGRDVTASQAYATWLAASPSSGAEGGAAAEDNVAHCFSSFMHQLEDQGISLLRQTKESRGEESSAGVAAEEDGDEEEGTQLDSTQRPDVVELSHMFARFVLAPGGPLFHGIKVGGEGGASSSHALSSDATYATYGAGSPFDKPSSAVIASLFQNEGSVALATDQLELTTLPQMDSDSHAAYAGSSASSPEGVQESSYIPSGGVYSDWGTRGSISLGAPPVRDWSIPTAPPNAGGLALGGSTAAVGSPAAVSPLLVPASPTASGPRRPSIVQQLQEKVGPKHAVFIAEQPEAMAMWLDVLQVASKVQEQHVLALTGLSHLSPSAQLGSPSAGNRMVQARTPGQERSSAVRQPSFSDSIADGADSLATPKSKQAHDEGQGEGTEGSTGAAATGGTGSVGVSKQAWDPMSGLSENTPEPPSPMVGTVLSEDRRSELEQIRLLNGSYAERLTEQADVAQMLAEQHQRSAERADELEVRLANATSELLQTKSVLSTVQDEILELTRMLVDVKMDLAEKDSVTLRLQQRLMRALNQETRSREENEELRRKIAVLSPEEAGVIMDGDFRNNIIESMRAPNLKASTKSASLR